MHGIWTKMTKCSGYVYHISRSYKTEIVHGTCVGIFLSILKAMKRSVHISQYPPMEFNLMLTKQYNQLRTYIQAIELIHTVGSKSRNCPYVHKYACVQW